MNWITIAAVGSTVCTVMAILGGLYSYINGLKENAVNDTLSRIDRNLDHTAQILDRHMDLLTEHATRIAAVEVEVTNLKAGLSAS
jgi:hypothetical protein